jgi:hypothetical protein
MNRYARVTIVYNMDDTAKSLKDELGDWYDGSIQVRDLFTDQLVPYEKWDSIAIEDVTAEVIKENEK